MPIQRGSAGACGLDMSNPRDPSFDGRARTGARATGSRPVRDPTESLAAPDDDLDPLSSSQAPMGTRDHVAQDEATRVESPAARNRTSPPGPPSSDRRRRDSRPTRPPRLTGERPEERLGSVLGSYRLVELLGRGGMGFVYRAEHIKLGRPVALKLLRADYARRRDSVARFFQEARTVNRARHRNIVDVTDFVELDDGTTFIIMELLEGESLGKWARAGFSIPRALALLVQICDGLSAAHAVGVIHRDLKPDNIVVLPAGDGAELVKLLDFGVAKLLNRDDEDLGLETQAGSVIGTPAYMSPEQAGGATVDVRSDIYSLGAIMYELFCGQPMFKGRSFGEFVRKHLNERPPAPRSTPGGAGLDERLELVILRCIEKDPDARYQSLAELRDDLLHLLGAIDTHVVSLRDLSATDPLSSGDLLPVSGRQSEARPPRAAGVIAPAPLPSAIAAPRARRPRRWPWLLVALIVTGAGTAAVVIALSGTTPTRPSRPATTGRDALRGPVTTPRVEALPAARAIAVEFRSTPTGAQVYPRDSDVPRCSTPCKVEIDPADGGSAIDRHFVVRADGHVDAPVIVVLAHPDPVEVELAPIAVRESPLHRRAARSRATTPEPATEADSAADDPVEARPRPADATDDDPARPPPKKTEKTRKSEKIDETVTIDPFRN
jgi:serine/threonine protein kinase